jgi:hypothetical protein
MRAEIVVATDLQADPSKVLAYAEGLMETGHWLRAESVKLAGVKLAPAEAGCSGVSEAVAAFVGRASGGVVRSAMTAESKAEQIATGVRGVQAASSDSAVGYRTGSTGGPDAAWRAQQQKPVGVGGE